MAASRLFAATTLSTIALVMSVACAESDAITPPGQGPGPASGTGGGDGGGGPGSGGAGSTSDAGSGGGAPSVSSSSGDGAGPATGGGGGGVGGAGSSSTGSTCGDGAIDDGEDCDGDDLGVATCGSLGFVSGTLACDGDCAFDTSACADVVACDNGVDDDGDGLVDDDDPACTSPDDDDELVYAPSCMGAGTPVVDLTTVAGLSVAYEGTTDEPGVVLNNFTSTAGGGCPSTPGPEVAFHLVVSEVVATMVVSLNNPGTETDWDPVLYVRAATCTGAQIGCNDDASGGVLASTLVLSNVQPGEYFLFVDGRTAADVGDFELTIDPS